MLPEEGIGYIIPGSECRSLQSPIPTILRRSVIGGGDTLVPARFFSRYAAMPDRLAGIKARERLAAGPRRRTPIIVAAVVLSLALLHAPHTPSAELRVALAAEASSVDPHFENLGPNNSLAAHVFDTLTRFDADGRLGPGLAESWRLIDETTWEFSLRRGVRFHDGTEFTAEDVVWSLDRTAKVNNGAFGVYTRQIVSKEIVDPYTLRLKTAAPYPLMLNDLSSVFIVSRRSTQGATSADFAGGKAAVGTGPFKLISFRLKERAELARNDAYWHTKPAWDKVTLRMITADPSRLAALQAGEVDAIDGVPTADIAKLRASPNLGVFSKVSARLIYITLDHARDSSPFITDKSGAPMARNPLKDLRVRQAMSKAINRQLIAEKVMEGLSLPTANLVPSTMFGHNPALPVERYDPEGARELLKRAGYGDGFGITLHGPNNRYVNDEQIMQAVAQMLARVGIAAKVAPAPMSVFLPRARKQEYTMALAGWASQTGEVSSPLRAVLATTNPAKGMGAYNFGAYSNPKMDNLLDEGLRTVDERQREKLLQEAVAVAITDVALIPIHHQFATWAARKGIAYVPRVDERTYAHQFVVQ